MSTEYRVPQSRREKPCRFRNLTDLEIKTICNGCGGKGGFFDPPDYCFTASCDHHDFNYWLGGDESDRTRVDEGFYHAMLHDARYRKAKLGVLHGRTELQPRRLLARLWLQGAAWRYYRAVRAMGGKLGAWVRKHVLRQKDAKPYFNYRAPETNDQQWSRLERFMQASGAEPDEALWDKEDWE